MRIGIMGGTFDPIHIGHLILGEAAYQQLHLGRVLYMPAGNPPHKTRREGRATDQQRLEMVRRAISGNPHLVLSEKEMHAEGYTYTYRTLESLLHTAPDTSIYFIIGGDSLKDFSKWKEPQRICDACTLAVAVRNHMSRSELDQEISGLRERFGARIVKLETENIDISSNQIREWIHEGRSVRYYLTDSVRQYIEAHALYRGDTTSDSSKFT